MKKTITIALQFCIALTMFAFTTNTAFADLPATGMAKPVADLRDWNGTHKGAFGTGTVSYSTLYRDSYDTSSDDCTGEGCGSHPGVDIRVPSNTNVYAAQGGTVIKSQCTSNGWGGLIIVKSVNPYIPGTFVYHSYAHLNQQLVAKDATVSIGQLIGKSGGDPVNGTCPGTSGGAHLHYQVDKDTAHTFPYFPSEHNRTVANPDSDFLVMQHTYNPIPFITGGYRWAFTPASGRPAQERELWDLINFESWGVGDSALWFDGFGDTYIRRGNTKAPCSGRDRPCSNAIAAEAAIYKSVHLDMFNHCRNGPLKVYFTTNTSTDWTEGKSVSFNVPWGAFNDHIPMSNNQYWTGIITGIRIDPATSCTLGAKDATYVGNVTIERGHSFAINANALEIEPVVLNPVYATSVLYRPDDISVGEQVSILTDVRKSSGSGINNIIDVEVYNSSGTKVHQRIFKNETLTNKVWYTFQTNWVPQTNGTYTVKVGIFSSDWSNTYHWNNNATTINVGSPAPTPSPTPTPIPELNPEIDIWWPSNDVTVSGLQPFLAILPGISLDQYTMEWQVDGGQLNAMYNSSEGGEHKEAKVDLVGWTWRGTGPYVITFVAKDINGKILAKRSSSITVNQ